MNPLKKRYLHIFGSALGIAGIFFVIARLYRYADQVNLHRFSALDWLLLALLACVYGGANLLMAVAWKRLLAFLGISTTRRWAIWAYGISQLAKYVPGNVFQFAGRQAIGMAAGIAGQPLLKSTLYELAMVAVAGALFAVLISPLLWNAVPVWAALACFGCLLVGVEWGLKRYLSSHLAAVWLLHALFLTISGMVFWAVLWMVSPAHHLPASATIICGAYVLAWLSGLVTPGAPAGVGVREAVLLFLLSKLIAPGDLVLAVVIGRMVTVVGDFMFFLFINVFLIKIHDQK